MSVDIFKNIIRNQNPEDVVNESLFREFTHAIPREKQYSEYIGQIFSDYPYAEHVAIMGSGNWGYSLNPDKFLRPFGSHSDIDIAIICHETFRNTWDELRKYHRNNYYLLSQGQRAKLKRNGENVYAGFVSPKWIFSRKATSRFYYDINSNKYSNHYVGYRQANMMYFKNKEEAVDYYIRGFLLAKGAI